MIIHNSFLIGILSTIFLFGWYERPETHLPDKQVIIQGIDKYQKDIDENLRALTLCENDALGFSTEGSNLLAYYKDKEFVKITATHFGETGKMEENMYLKDGKILFLHSVHTNYDRFIYDEGEVQTLSEEKEDLYFSEGTLILWVKDRVTIPENSPEYHAQEEELKKNLDELRSFLTKENCKNLLVP